MQLNEAQEEIIQRKDKADKMTEATPGATQMALQSSLFPSRKRF